MRGFFRGMGARITSAMLWGTTMSSAFEMLKRACAREEEEDGRAGKK